MRSIKSLLLVLYCVVTCVAQLPPKLPNIGYIGYGYNVFYGNPHDTSQFDPGFGQAPIFEFTYSQLQTTTDGKWLVPDNVAVPGTATECSVEGTSQTIQSAYDYQTSLSVSVSVDLSGFGASFSASTDYKKVDETTSSNSDVYVSTTASCQTYLVNINAYVHPNFSSVFATQGSRLPLKFNASNAGLFWEFFDLVGTHFPTQIIFGSRWGYSFQSSQAQWSTIQKMDLDVTVAASYAGLIKAGVTVKNDYAQQMASNFTSLTTNTQEYSLGIAPPASGDTYDWLQTSLSSTLMDPLQYTLSNISELFSPFYSPNLALNARYQAVSEALNAYCSLQLLPNNIINSCKRPPIPPPPPPPIGYASLACQSATDCYHNWASVFDGTSDIQAQDVALDLCPACTSIQIAVSNGACFGLALSAPPHDAWGYCYGTNNETGMSECAVAECKKYSDGSVCNVATSGCAEPPPPNSVWGAIACTSDCNSHYATSQGYPDRIEAHHIAMESLVGSYIAVDFNQCGAIVKASSGGLSTATGDTPQDAINLAMKTCQTTLSGCVLLTHACATSSIKLTARGMSVARSLGH